jgi:hypothetical protein
MYVGRALSWHIIALCVLSFKKKSFLSVDFGVY